MSRRHVIMFQPRFAALVESGAKLQTIRPLRKRCPILGDVIDARQWSGRPYHSKQRKLGDRLALGTERIVIHADGIEFSPGTLRYLFWHEQRADLVNAFARADGFKDWADMRAWFSATHAVPFEGVLIKWRPNERRPAMTNEVQALAAAQGSALVAWEVEINYMTCIVFAATKAKAKWLAVKSYWEAFSRTQAWPHTGVARRPQYDRFPHRERKAYSPEYVRDLC